MDADVIAVIVDSELRRQTQTDHMLELRTLNWVVDFVMKRRWCILSLSILSPGDRPGMKPSFAICVNYQTRPGCVISGSSFKCCINKHWKKQWPWNKGEEFILTTHLCSTEVGAVLGFDFTGTLLVNHFTALLFVGVVDKKNMKFPTWLCHC